MNEKKPVKEMDFAEVLDIMSDPMKHKGKMTLGDLCEMAKVLDQLASAGAKLQNPQGNISEFEAKLKDQERRIRMLEAKFSVLYEMITGGAEDEESHD